MSLPTIAEIGWSDFTIDHLRQALKSAENTASDLAKLRICDEAKCGRMFDCTDPRGHHEPLYNFCPACTMEAHGLPKRVVA